MRAPAAILAAAGLAAASTALAQTPVIPGARLIPLAFADLPGWREDAVAAATPAFLRSCRAIVSGAPELRLARPTPPELARACRAALETPPDDLRAFLERWFSPVEVIPDTGPAFFTGYFEPEFPGALTPSEAFATPIHGRPDDLATLAAGDPRPAGFDPALSSARRGPGGLEPYPDRAAIEAGALDGRGLEIAWVRDPVDRFIMQVQGSARLVSPDGRVTRLRYAGRNGRPYVSIGRILIEEGRIPRDEMSLERLTGWLRAHGEEGRAIMRRNPSYVFFARDAAIAPQDGPIGGAGVNLTEGRSIAVDRGVWPYGLPAWIAVESPRADGRVERLARLVVAQDTGSAIVGPARIDVFFGSGAAAGTRAGLLRHDGRFVVLWPRPEPLP